MVHEHSWRVFRAHMGTLQHRMDVMASVSADLGKTFHHEKLTFPY